MQQQDELACAFCDKSDTKLVTHSLCDWCLVHSECCAATAGKLIPVGGSMGDVARRVECDVCCEEFEESELQQHQGTCTPRLVFRCSLCYEDYLTEKSLWNHLTVHKIAYEERELYYLEKRVSYKQHTCILCNDQRSYQESCYWEHVHEDHDGFYIQCTDCGENFRSQKRKAEHALNHCKFKGRNSEHTAQAENGEPEKDFEANETIELDSDSDVEIIHDGRQQTSHRCTQCDKEFNCAKKLARHIDTSHRATDCDVCGLPFSSNNQLYYHKARQHAKRLYQCSTCKKSFALRYEYMRHLVVHQEKKYACIHSGCPFKSKAKEALDRHIRGFHEKKPLDSLKNIKKKQLGIEKTDCPICHQNFDDQDQVAQHVEEVHKAIMCTICRQVFLNAVELTKHKCSTCPHCRKGCYNLTRLVSHIELCHTMIVCEICGESFLGKSRMWYHKVKFHSEPQLKCPQCSKKFHLKCEYTRHRTFCVRNESKFPCKLCGRKFDSFDHVTTHLRSAHGVTRPQTSHEDGEGEMSDDIADVKQEQADATEMESSVKVEEASSDPNMVTDVPVKFYQRCNKPGEGMPCRICGRRFRRADYLRKHMNRGHSFWQRGKGKTNRYVSCKICGKTSPNYSQLKYHMLICHTEPKHKCPYCPEAFHIRNSYTRHVVTHEKHNS